MDTFLNFDNFGTQQKV